LYPTCFYATCPIFAQAHQQQSPAESELGLMRMQPITVSSSLVSQLRLASPSSPTISAQI
jgi:hypothetical protein